MFSLLKCILISQTTKKYCIATPTGWDQGGSYENCLPTKIFIELVIIFVRDLEQNFIPNTLNEALTVVYVQALCLQDGGGSTALRQDFRPISLFTRYSGTGT